MLRTKQNKNINDLPLELRLWVDFEKSGVTVLLKDCVENCQFKLVTCSEFFVKFLSEAVGTLSSEETEGKYIILVIKTCGYII